jgi:hypothetical protein
MFKLLLLLSELCMFYEELIQVQCRNSIEMEFKYASKVRTRIWTDFTKTSLGLNRNA